MYCQWPQLIHVAIALKFPTPKKIYPTNHMGNIILNKVTTNSSPPHTSDRFLMLLYPEQPWHIQSNCMNFLDAYLKKKDTSTNFSAA